MNKNMHIQHTHIEFYFLGGGSIGFFAGGGARGFLAADVAADV